MRLPRKLSATIFNIEMELDNNGWDYEAVADTHKQTYTIIRKKSRLYTDGWQVVTTVTDKYLETVDSHHFHDRLKQIISGLNS